MLDELIKTLPPKVSLAFRKRGNVIEFELLDIKEEYDNVAHFSQDLQDIFDMFKANLTVAYYTPGYGHHKRAAWVLWHGGGSPGWFNAGGFRDLKEIKAWLPKFRNRLDVALMQGQGFVRHDREPN